MIDWKQEPYRAAKVLVGYNKDKALELIELFKLVKEMGLTDYREHKLIRYE